MPIHITLQRTNELSLVNTPLFLPSDRDHSSVLSNTCTPLSSFTSLSSLVLLRSPAENWPKCRIFFGGSTIRISPSVSRRPAGGGRGGGGRRRRGRGRRCLWRLLSRLVADAGRPSGAVSPLPPQRCDGGVGGGIAVAHRERGDALRREMLGREERGRTDLILRGSANASELVAMRNKLILHSVICINLAFCRVKWIAISQIMNS